MAQKEFAFAFIPCWPTTTTTLAEAALPLNECFYVTSMWCWCSTDSPVGKSLLLIIRAFFIDLATVGDAT